jgi:cell division protein FtsZ
MEIDNSEKKVEYREEMDRPDRDVEKQHIDETPYQEPQEKPNTLEWEIQGSLPFREKQEPSIRKITPEELEEQNDDKGPVGGTISKDRLIRQALERRQSLENKSLHGQNGLEPDEFKERLEKPAYERKKVQFKPVPDSSERKISRYNLNDENEILGDNKFLHDNVD